MPFIKRFYRQEDMTVCVVVYVYPASMELKNNFFHQTSLYCWWLYACKAPLGQDRRWAHTQMLKERYLTIELTIGIQTWLFPFSSNTPTILQLFSWNSKIIDFQPDMFAEMFTRRYLTIEQTMGPSIKYVTLEGERSEKVWQFVTGEGPRACDITLLIFFIHMKPKI